MRAVTVVKSGVEIIDVDTPSPNDKEVLVKVHACGLNRADLVVADSIDQCQERGEIACALRDGDITKQQIVELGDVLSGKKLGRQNEKQVTVADLTGVAVQDIQIATAVFKTFLENKNEI